MSIEPVRNYYRVTRTTVRRRTRSVWWTSLSPICGMTSITTKKRATFGIEPNPYSHIEGVNLPWLALARSVPRVSFSL